MISTTYIFNCLSRSDFVRDNLSMKSVQFLVSSKCELMNSSLYEQFIDVSEILVSGTKFALKE